MHTWTRDSKYDELCIRLYLYALQSYRHIRVIASIYANTIIKRDFVQTYDIATNAVIFSQALHLKYDLK